MTIAVLARLSLVCALILVGDAVALAQTALAEPRSESQSEAQWLEERSMLFQARQAARQISGHGAQWQHRYGDPQSREAVKVASVWLLDYPGSVITRPGKSVVGSWGEEDLWQALEAIGIELLHTGPLRESGAIEGRRHTPTIDGWFDPISLKIDPQLGNQEEYQHLVRTAANHGASIAGDLIPLHTGMGPDFRLAEMAYQDYPGLYTMVEIDEADWQLLPAVDGRWQATVVPKDVAEKLQQKGYIPGLINSNDATPQARELSGWSATGPIEGVDGKTRRWVFLHYFKKEQPTLNWLDPSFAAQRAVSGDIVRTVHMLGARVMRLDAIPFLGIEPQPGEKLTRHFKHPLAVQGTNSLAFLIRKLGGFSFQELNIPLKELKAFTEHGPDLSYDFFTRAQCVHALLVEDATFLRQAFQMLLDADVQPRTLVHDLQNHDEVTYQLTELDSRGDELFDVQGRQISGRQLREQLLREVRSKAAGARAPHNRLYRPERDGLATTFAAFVAAALEIRDPYHATREDLERIKAGHLLLAAANAMQPGVFSLSSWDLVGALPISEESVKERIADGDFRWLNRGGVDLMGANPQAEASAIGIERAKSLYGSLPEQLKDSRSFTRQLGHLLATRKKYHIAEGELLSVPPTNNKGCCLIVFRVPEQGMAITALNFSQTDAEETLDLHPIAEKSNVKLGGAVLDILGDEHLGQLPQTGRLTIKIQAMTAKTLIVNFANP